MSDYSEYIGKLVEFSDGIKFMETYSEPKMRAKIIDMFDDTDDHPNKEDVVVRITFDYTDFDEYNKEFDRYNYYDQEDVPRLNARQAGFYKPVDKNYFGHPDLYPFETYFKIIS
jgi:hypothetical protein